MTQWRKMNPLARREAMAGLLFIAPVLLYFLVFQIAPMLIALFYSFTKWNMIKAPEWVGLANYRNLLFDRLLYPNFWPSLWVTLKYVLWATPFALTIPLGLALLLNREVKGDGFFKTAFYIPVVTAGVAVAAMWKWILDPQYGLLDLALSKLPLVGDKLAHLHWLGERSTALPTLALMGVWGGIGYNVLIYLSQLKNIPVDMYEAGAIDGAVGWKRFWFITLPMMKPTVFFLMVTGLIGGFQVFDSMFLLTRGGPNDSTLTYVLSLYRHGFEYREMGTASAMSYILFIIILVVTLLQFKFVPQNYNE